MKAPVEVAVMRTAHHASRGSHWTATRIGTSNDWFSRDVPRARCSAWLHRSSTVVPTGISVETAWRAPREQRPGALQKHQYRELDVL
jgi:hypothetical protein